MKKIAAVLLASAFAMSGTAFGAAHMAGEKPKDGMKKEMKENPCAAKKNPCAAKENPCAAKKNPCAAKKSEKKM